MWFPVSLLVRSHERFPVRSLAVASEQAPDKSAEGRRRKENTRKLNLFLVARVEIHAGERPRPSTAAALLFIYYLPFYDHKLLTRPLFI